MIKSGNPQYRGSLPRMKMSVKLSLLEKAALFCFALSFLAMTCYGLLVKFTIGNSFLFSAKTLIPEVSTFLGAIFLVFSSRSSVAFKHSELMLLLIVASVMIVNIPLAESSTEVLVVVRDVFMPLCMLLILCGINISQRFREHFVTLFSALAILYLLGTGVLWVIEFRNGYEWTEFFYTGYTFWGTDPYSKIVVSSNGMIPRLPTLAGSSVKSATYCVFAVLLIFANRNYKLFTKWAFAIFGLLLIVALNNRASLLAMIIVLVLLFSYSFEINLSRLVKYAMLAICIAFLAYLLLSQSSSMNSLFDRFNLWSDIITSDAVSNLLFPMAVYSVSALGSGLEGLSLTTSWDNGFLYFAESFGIAALILLMVVFSNYWKRAATDVSEERTARLIIVATVILALSTNVFNGRCWISMLPLILPFLISPVIADRSSAESLDRQLWKERRYQK